MKKIIAITFIVILIFGCMSTAFAATRLEKMPYNGSCSSNFYTNSFTKKAEKQKIVNENSYARKDSASGAATAYTSRIYVGSNSTSQHIQSGLSHAFITALGGTTKLRVVNENSGSKLYAAGNLCLYTVS